MPPLETITEENPDLQSGAHWKTTKIAKSDEAIPLPYEEF
jgi:hypothetical protein